MHTVNREPAELDVISEGPMEGLILCPEFLANDAPSLPQRPFHKCAGDRSQQFPSGGLPLDCVLS